MPSSSRHRARAGPASAQDPQAAPAPYEGQYDPDEFMVPAADAQGRSTHLACRVLPEIDRLVDEIIAARKFPYRTKGDLVRHAVQRHLEWMHALEPTLASSWNLLAAAQEVLRAEQFAVECEQIFERLASLVDGAIAKDDTKEVMRLLGKLRVWVNRLQDTGWRTDFKRRFYDKYGHFFRPTA